MTNKNKVSRRYIQKAIIYCFLQNKEMISEICFSGLFIGLIVFGVWYVLINEMHMEQTLARGYIMALMVFLQNMHAFNCRSERESVFLIPIKNNPFLMLEPQHIRKERIEDLS